MKERAGVDLTYRKSPRNGLSDTDRPTNTEQHKFAITRSRSVM
jgi:hypothetical protein